MIRRGVPTLDLGDAPKPLATIGTGVSNGRGGSSRANALRALRATAKSSTFESRYNAALTSVSQAGTAPRKA